MSCYITYVVSCYNICYITNVMLYNIWSCHVITCCYVMLYNTSCYKKYVVSCYNICYITCAMLCYITYVISCYVI